MNSRFRLADNFSFSFFFSFTGDDSKVNLLC